MNTDQSVTPRPHPGGLDITTARVRRPGGTYVLRFPGYEKGFENFSSAEIVLENRARDAGAYLWQEDAGTFSVMDLDTGERTFTATITRND